VTIDGHEGNADAEPDATGDRNQAPLEAIDPTPISQTERGFAQAPGPDRGQAERVGGVVVEIERLDLAMLVALWLAWPPWRRREKLTRS